MTIKLVIDGKEMTLEEARKLYDELRALFDPLPKFDPSAQYKRIKESDWVSPIPRELR